MYCTVTYCTVMYCTVMYCTEPRQIQNINNFTKTGNQGQHLNKSPQPNQTNQTSQQYSIPRYTHPRQPKMGPIHYGWTK